MVKKILYYSAAMIILYLVLVNYTGFSSDVTASSQGGTSLIKAFQGR
jgi:hypothetical protein